jgi:phosphoribosylformimino-5-aminoimidazole carboxamide ribotide isomerase
VIVIPAIDLMGGKAVRLQQGDRDRVTTYADDPRGLALRFIAAGARRLHVVDLDGAFEGRQMQADLIATLSEAAAAGGCKVQCGGGLRSAEAIERLLQTGVDQAVIGTLAVQAPEIVEELCQRHPGRIIVAADARGDEVAVAGWVRGGGISVVALATAAERWGAAAVLYTDVERDGTRGGPAVVATAALQREVRIPVFASGGVGTLEHLDACATAGIQGVVLGRALYDGAFSVEEALARC